MTNQRFCCDKLIKTPSKARHLQLSQVPTCASALTRPIVFDSLSEALISGKNHQNRWYLAISSRVKTNTTTEKCMIYLFQWGKRVDFDNDYKRNNQTPLGSVRSSKLWEKHWVETRRRSLGHWRYYIHKLCKLQIRNSF